MRIGWLVWAVLVPAVPAAAQETDADPDGSEIVVTGRRPLRIDAKVRGKPVRTDLPTVPITVHVPGLAAGRYALIRFDTRRGEVDGEETLGHDGGPKRQYGRAVHPEEKRRFGGRRHGADMGAPRVAATPPPPGAEV